MVGGKKRKKYRIGKRRKDEYCGREEKRKWRR